MRFLSLPDRLRVVAVELGLTRAPRWMIVAAYEGGMLRWRAEEDKLGVEWWAPVTIQLATGWLRRAEKLAGLEPLAGGSWHPFRRAWATARTSKP